MAPSFPTPTLRTGEPSRKDIMDRLAPYAHSSNARATWELVKSIVPWLLVHVVCHWFSAVWYVRAAAVVMLSLLKVRLFVQFHDMGHGSFFTSLTWNRIVGHVVGSFTYTPFDSWKVPHSTHHAHLGKSDRNEEQAGELPVWTVDQYRAQPRFVRFIYRIYRSPFVLFLVLPQYVFLLSYRWVADHVICNVLSLARLVVLYKFGLLGDELIASMISNTAGFFMFFGQHTYNPFLEQTHEKYDSIKAGIFSCTYFKMPAFFHWCTAYIGFHHIHHITTRVPSYFLMECHRNTRDLWKDVTRVTVADVYANRHLALWDDATKRYVECATVEAQIRDGTDGAKFNQAEAKRLLRQAF